MAGPISPRRVAARMVRVLTCPLRGEARVTSSGLLVPEIDGLRFFCIMAVVLLHANPFSETAGGGALPVITGIDEALRTLIAAGGAGVSLFFGISGFVLGLPFLDHYRHGRPAPKLGAYFLRRVLRIEPPYFICLLLLFTLRALALRQNEAGHLLASGVYMHNLLYGVPSTINPVAWSLEVEIQFYLIAPFLSRIFAIPARGLRRLAILWLCIVPSAVLEMTQPPHWVDLTLAGQLQYFMAGFLSLDLYDEWRGGARRASIAWDGLTVGAWMLVVLQLYPSVNIPIRVAACTLSLVAAFRGPLLSRCVRSPPIVGIGGMCYTIYLYHPVVRKPLDLLLVSVAPSGIPWLDALARLGVVVPYTVAICTVLFLLFERPFMVRDWHKRWGAVLGAPQTWLPRADAFLRA